MAGGGDGGMNWAIGTDMYALMCIKWMTNKNLLYKKINKIQKKSHFFSALQKHFENNLLFSVYTHEKTPV